MSDKGEKGNPLDRLTRPGGRPLSDDESIPILTERLTLPSLDLDISLPKAPLTPEVAPAQPPPPRPPAASVPPPPRPTAPRAPESAAPGRFAATPVPIPTYSSAATAATEVAAPEIDWVALEQKLREAVFRELQPALADEAGRLLRERLQPSFERALLATTAELRQIFDARLREAIARAIAAELARQRPRS